jgi:hypothetical protein
VTGLEVVVTHEVGTVPLPDDMDPVDEPSGMQRLQHLRYF